MRLKDKIAVVVGAGQSPGEGLGNGRATVLRFAQEGAKVLAVDNILSSAEETVAMAAQSGGECFAFEADVTKEATLATMVEAARRRWGRVDILHYNVGVSIAGGDAPLDEITEAAFDRIATINLRGAIMACKHVLPLIRAPASAAKVGLRSRPPAMRACRCATRWARPGMSRTPPFSSLPTRRISLPALRS